MSKTDRRLSNGYDPVNFTTALRFVLCGHKMATPEMKQNKSYIYTNKGVNRLILCDSGVDNYATIEQLLLWLSNNGNVWGIYKHDC